MDVLSQPAVERDDQVMSESWWKRVSSVGILMALLLLAACQTPVSRPIAGVPTTVDGVPRISVQELRERLDSGADVLVVDARPAESYEEGHISGAVSMPLPELAQRYNELSRTAEIVFYCT